MAAAKWKTAVLALAIAGAGVLFLALLSGILFEFAQRAHDRERYPQIGRSVDIGGRSLNIDCAGAGQPAVVLESGADWPLSAALRGPQTIFANGGPRPGYSWVSVQRDLAPLTTVCWYDRAGSGWSDPGPYPRDSASHAHDLHALLGAAHIPPPYILVGESSAALDARVYTGFYPSEVAGLALVNWADPALSLDLRANNAKRMPAFAYRSQDAAAPFFHLVGLYRLHPIPPAPAPPSGLAAAEWNTIWFLTHSSKAMSALMQDIAAWRLSSAEARAAGPLGSRPLYVLGAANLAAPPEFLERWARAQAGLVRLSTRGKQITAGDGASDLLHDAPGAIVDAIRQVVLEVRMRQ